MRNLALSVAVMMLSSSLASAVMPLNITASGKVIADADHPIVFTLKNPGTEAATTTVFTIQGKQVAELTAQSLSRFVWDGKDVDQQDVDAGLYVVQIQHGGSYWHSPVLVNR